MLSVLGTGVLLEVWVGAHLGFEQAAESPQYPSILEGLTGALRSPSAAPTTLRGAQMAPKVGEHWSCHRSGVQDPSDLGNWPCAPGSVLKFQSCQGGRSVFQALHRSVQLNIVFPSGLQRWMQRQSSHREREHPHSLGESLLPAPAVGGTGERLTLGEGQLDLRRLLSQGAGFGDLALFIWTVDIAWRKEQRNVGLVSSSSSSGSAQL